MKEVEVKTETISVFYEAADGKKFDNKEECIKYERTVACMVNANIVKNAISAMFESEVFANGSTGATSYTLLPKTKQDIRDIQMLESYIKSKYDASPTIQADNSMIGQIIVVTIGECDEWVDIWSLNSLVDSLTNGAYVITSNNKGE